MRGSPDFRRTVMEMGVSPSAHKRAGTLIERDSSVWTVLQSAVSISRFNVRSWGWIKNSGPIAELCVRRCGNHKNEGGEEKWEGGVRGWVVGAGNHGRIIRVRLFAHQNC